MFKCLNNILIHTNSMDKIKRRQKQVFILKNLNAKYNILNCSNKTPTLTSETVQNCFYYHFLTELLYSLRYYVEKTIFFYQQYILHRIFSKKKPKWPKKVILKNRNALITQNALIFWFFRHQILRVDNHSFPTVYGMPLWYFFCYLLNLGRRCVHTVAQ